ncbi:MAG: hypothetical protein VXW49_08855, partial [Pseudomonadota bacterium]|nr:hypothetical protein [Pseudomonadota bacterium]
MSIASNLNHNARARTWRRFRRHKLAMASLIVLFALIAAAAAARSPSFSLERPVACWSSGLGSRSVQQPLFSCWLLRLLICTLSR